MNTYSNLITDQQIADLSTEAAQAGDLAMVALCDRAIAGDEEARSRCYLALSDAAASDPDEFSMGGIPGAVPADIIAAIRARRVDDVIRAITRTGIRLTHDEAADLGEEALGWCRRRLSLVTRTDDAGVLLAPLTE